MRKGFTLMEIMIVIVIISILLTITMNFGSNRINDLARQSTKEQFVGAYDKLYSQNMTSNYHEGTRYESLQIDLDKGAGQINYYFDDITGSSSIKGNFTITGLQLDNEMIKNAQLNLIPYQLECEIVSTEGSGTNLSFDILIENTKKYCFTITSNTCKLIEINCDQHR